MPFAPDTRPLTQEEINGLRVNMVMPTIMIAAIGLGVIVIAALVVLPMWDRPFIKWFASAALLLLLTTAVFVWLHVRNNAGDLRDGVALQGGLQEVGDVGPADAVVGQVVGPQPDVQLLGHLNRLDDGRCDARHRLHDGPDLLRRLAEQVEIVAEHLDRHLGVDP